jgi:hypothetical protein
LCLKKIYFGRRKDKMKFEDLENEIMKLSLKERALLAEKLILSIDAPSETENLKLWVV